MPRQLSDDGAAFTAEQEGAVPYWYRDALGVWTIGIGHAWTGTDEFADVAIRSADGTIGPGRRLSDEEMWALFRTDAARYVEAVDRLVTVDLTQRQFDMLVDFAFNWGIGDVGGFPATSILRLVNARDFAGVARELVDGRGPITNDWPQGRPYDKGLAGVRRRRELEAAAFMKMPADIIYEAIAECEAAGRPVVWVDGCEDRGRPYRFEPQCVRCHHTATGGYAYDYASLGIVRDGRSDLPGPLSQFGLGRHTGTIYVIAFGYANDGGGGGWMDLSGNGSGFGIEAENDGIGEEWGPEITESYIVLVAALLRAMGRGAEFACRHAEWSDGGKIDTATAPFEDGDWIRARVAERLNASPIPEPEEPEVAKIAYPVTVESGEHRRIPVPAIAGGMGWTVCNVTYASSGVKVTRARVGPYDERDIPDLSGNWSGRHYIELKEGDEWVEVELGGSPAGTLELMVEASDG